MDLFNSVLVAAIASFWLRNDLDLTTGVMNEGQTAPEYQFRHSHAVVLLNHSVYSVFVTPDEMIEFLSRHVQMDFEPLSALCLQFSHFLEQVIVASTSHERQTDIVAQVANPIDDRDKLRPSFATTQATDAQKRVSPLGEARCLTERWRMNNSVNR